MSLTSSTTPLSHVMGSKSDWETMRHAAIATELPASRMSRDVCLTARLTLPLSCFHPSARGIEIIIAASGGAAHLAAACRTYHSTVLGLPRKRCLNGRILCLPPSMPAGICPNIAIGNPGASPASLQSAFSRIAFRNSVHGAEFRERQEPQVAYHTP